MSRNTNSLLTWLLFPAYVWQGLGVRRKTMRLAPPKGKTVLGAKGKGQPIKVLLIGDSSAAGVGVKSIENSLGGQIFEKLQTKSKRPIEVRIAGNNSATSGQIRDFVVPHIEQRDYTHVILNIGTNDAKNFHTGNRFCREFGTLLYVLKARFPDARIIWSSILDLSGVPSLPPLLGKILGWRSDELRHRGEILCRERGAVIPEGEWNPDPVNFSIDGFHASETGYSQWAAILVEHILKDEG